MHGAALYALWARLLPTPHAETTAAFAELQRQLDAAPRGVLSVRHVTMGVELLAALALSGWEEKQGELVHVARSLADEVARAAQRGGDRGTEDAEGRHDGNRASAGAGADPVAGAGETPDDASGAPAAGASTTAIHRVLPLVLFQLVATPGRTPRYAPLLRLACKHGAFPISLALGAQTLAWAPERAPQLSPALRLRAVRALWYEEGTFAPHGAGAAQLLHATMLHAVLDAVHAEHVPLGAWQAHEEHRAELARCVALAHAPGDVPRLEALRHLLDAFIALLTDALADTMERCAASDEAAALRAAPPGEARQAAIRQAAQAVEKASACLLYTSDAADE